MLTVNFRKFGETSNPGNAEPSPSNWKGVETRHGTSRTDEGIVQTANMKMAAKAVAVRKSPGHMTVRVRVPLSAIWEVAQ